jgi:archaellum component FlaC
MKQDVIYKLDDTNSALKILNGTIVFQGRDITYLVNQVKGLDIRLEGLTQEVRTIQEQQNVQGQDIRDMKRRLDGMDQRFDGMDQRLDGMDQRFDGMDQRFDGMDQRFDGIAQRLDGIDQRFTTLEEKLYHHFGEVLQVLATLTNKANTNLRSERQS